MADTATASAASAPASAPAQASPKKTKASAFKPAHPETSEIVCSAIKSLKERGGSSLQAIKTYISAKYKVDSEKLAPFIKKYLKSAVASGELVQTKGKGASGSFKLASASKPAHPKTSEMVGSAIKSLKEPGGSSLKAIRKYISANYKVDSEKLAPFIKKYLKSAVASGELVQTKGKGALGSFKLASACKPAHPKTSEMVGSAIKSLKEPGGSSLQAIRKYISANYKVDSKKLAPFIKKYLKSAVASGELVQTTGKGALGSFKLASAAKPEKVSAAPAKRSGAPKEKRIPKAKKSGGAKAAAKRAISKQPFLKY